MAWRHLHDAALSSSAGYNLAIHLVNVEEYQEIYRSRDFRAFVVIRVFSLCAEREG